ncbi:pyrroline-5-carboxylate reductase [Echinimonas agarilytica]|uniref:pyrroline-5-carboxylate reductase n=1 Tax=Echinimonas agarilytica TaxID=1215918 RepID=UPI0025580AD6|nr:pyrroline-5-carboxylate reductase [Echinimonas agarilytica]
MYPIVTFIGAGNMASAIFKGLIKQGHPADRIRVSNRSQGKLDALKQEFPTLHVSTNNAEAVADADVVVLAVKPQMMEDMLKPLTTEVAGFDQKLFVSVAAGISIARLQSMLNGAKRIVRTMPNTPSLIGLGMTGLFAQIDTSDADKNLADSLMAAVGKTAWVSQEAEINQVIAAAGSSPAYFFMFMNAMQKSLEGMGMDSQTARKLVEQAAIGSSQLAAHQSDKTLTELTQQVTSKGGTTAQAVATFENGDLAGLVDQAMQACVARAEEMEKLL